MQSALTAFVKQPGTVGIGMGLQFFGQPQPLVPGCITQSCVKDADCGNGCAVCMPQGLCQGPFNPDIDSCDAVDCAWAEVPIHEVDPQGRRKAHCPPSGDAWYHDVGPVPTWILLCGATCATVSKDLMAEVDVVLGCATIVK